MANSIQSFIKNENPPEQDKLNRPRRVVFIIFNIGLTILLSILLFCALGNVADKYPPANNSNTVKSEEQESSALTDDSLSFQQSDSIIEPDTGAVSADDSIVKQPATDSTAKKSIVQKNAEITGPGNRIILDLLYIMLLTGALGGVLCNLRGIFQRFRDESGTFRVDLEVPYYIRPFSGALCGMMFFFLTSFFAASLTDSGARDLGWDTFAGIFPYAGIAFIAGYASQEFMERLKEIAKAIFPGQKETNNPPEGDQERK